MLKLFPEFKYPYKRCHRNSCNKNLGISYNSKFNKVDRCCFESMLLEYGPTLAMKYYDIHNPYVYYHQPVILGMEHGVVWKK